MYKIEETGNEATTESWLICDREAGCEANRLLRPRFLAGQGSSRLTSGLLTLGARV